MLTRVDRDKLGAATGVEERALPLQTPIDLSDPLLGDATPNTTTVSACAFHAVPGASELIQSPNRTLLQSMYRKRHRVRRPGEHYSLAQRQHIIISR